MIRTALLASTLLAVALSTGGCALFLAGVAGGVIVHEMNRGYCGRHPYDPGCEFYMMHPRESRAWAQRSGLIHDRRW